MPKQNLITLVVGGCGRVVSGHAKPSVAVAQHDAFEVPRRDMRGHAGVQQQLRRDASLRQLAKVDRIDLGYPDIDTAIVVAVHCIGAHARFNLQDGPQDMRVGTMALRGLHQAWV